MCLDFINWFVSRDSVGIKSNTTLPVEPTHIAVTVGEWAIIYLCLSACLFDYSI